MGLSRGTEGIPTRHTEGTTPGEKVEEKKIPPEEIEEDIKRIEEIGNNIREDDLVAFTEKEIEKALDEQRDLRYDQMPKKYGEEEKERPKEINEALKKKYNELADEKDRTGRRKVEILQFPDLSPEEQEKQYTPWKRQELMLQNIAYKLIKLGGQIEGDPDLTEEGKKELLEKMEAAKEEFRKKHQELREKKKEEMGEEIGSLTEKAGAIGEEEKEEEK